MYSHHSHINTRRLEAFLRGLKGFLLAASLRCSKSSNKIPELQQILSERNMISFWNDNNVLFLFSWNQIGKSYIEMKTVLCFFFVNHSENIQLAEVEEVQVEKYVWWSLKFSKLWWWLVTVMVVLGWASLMQVRSPLLSAQTSLRQESCFGSKWIRWDDQKLEIKDYKMYFPCFKIETII